MEPRAEHSLIDERIQPLHDVEVCDVGVPHLVAGDVLVGGVAQIDVNQLEVQTAGAGHGLHSEADTHGPLHDLRLHLRDRQSAGLHHCNVVNFLILVDCKIVRSRRCACARKLVVGVVPAEDGGHNLVEVPSVELEGGKVPLAVSEVGVELVQRLSVEDSLVHQFVVENLLHVAVDCCVEGLGNDVHAGVSGVRDGSVQNQREEVGLQDLSDEGLEHLHSQDVASGVGVGVVVIQGRAVRFSAQHGLGYGGQVAVGLALQDSAGVRRGADSRGVVEHIGECLLN